MPRQSLAAKIIGAIFAAGLLFAGWVFFAPMQLGGSTTYAVTSGISMEPLLHKNDLAFVRTRSSYAVGDVVLYQSAVVHRPVLHRIILIEDGNYYFKGDNNNFIDPGFATRSELTGTLWFSVPAVGSVLAWFGTPSHAALLAGLTTMAVALMGVTTTKGRRRRRRGVKAMSSPQRPARLAPTPTRADATAGSTGRAYVRRPSPYFEGPVASLAALGVAMLLTLMFLVMGFSRPVQRTGVLSDAYQQAGTFSYSAIAKAPTDVYASGAVETGDPIYPSLVDTVSLHFEYLFASALPHNIAGTIELRAQLLSTTDTWQEISTVVPSTAFSGDAAAVSSDLALAGLYAFIDSVIADTGIAGTNYSVDIQPVVHIEGTVGDQSIDTTFSPVLPFAVSRTAIRIDAPVAALPTGATSTAAAASSMLDAALKPIHSGGIPHLVANELSVAKYKVRVAALRTLGIAFGILSLLLAGVHDRLRRRQPRRSEEEQIAQRFHALIVPVASLGPAQAHTQIEVPDFASLAGLARFLERPILYEVLDGHRTFAVDDDSLRYVTSAKDRRHGRVASEPTHRDGDGTMTDPDAMPTDTKSHRKQVMNSASSNGRSRRVVVARGGAAFLFLAVAATLTMSFTASTTVPASKAGLTFVGGAVSQGTPAGCSALNLDSLVTGKGTFSTSDSHALILGSSGVDTINATGTYNCIVGGGGKDKVTGKTSDVCIIGPTTGATYTNCTKKAH